MSRSFVQISTRILEPRLPELGHIKIGGKGDVRKSRGGREFRLPEKYDHFVVTQRARDKKTENLMRDERVHGVIGAEPRELDVRLLFDEPAANWQAFLAAYDGRQKRCSGNGEQAEDAVHGAIPCTCPWFKGHAGEYTGPPRQLGQGAPTCKPHGRLSVILEAAETFGGFYVFRTTSWETIRSITASLQLYKEQFGYLAGLPLRMVIYPATDTYEEGGTTKTSTSYKVALVLRGSFDTAKQIAKSAFEVREQLALPSPAQADVHRKALLEDEERDAEEISQEFHPETAVAVEEYVEGEVLTEEEAAEEELQKDLEELCRYALELVGWDKDRINRQIAKYSDDLRPLADVLREKMPREWMKAQEDLAPEDAAVEEVEEELADDGEAAEQEELL